MRPLCLLLAACYAPPDLPTRPWEAPVLAGAVCAPARVAPVACVLDGDTVVLGPDPGVCPEDAERVRLLGIDAPETARGGRPADCGADAATAELERLVLGRPVVLTFDRACADAYDRTLAYAWLDDPDLLDADRDLLLEWQAEDGPAAVGGAVLLDAWLLLGGFARRWPDRDGPLAWAAVLDAAEARARAEGRGIWSACR